MIYLGLTNAEKLRVVREYVAAHRVRRVVEIGHEPALLRAWDESLTWPDVIMYRYFYRLLQELDDGTLLVINEVLRSSDRSCLHYNCIRNYLTRTQHQLVFSWLPVVEQEDDLMVLVDLDTRSRWRRSRLSGVGEKLRVDGVCRAPTVKVETVACGPKTHAKYQKTRDALFSGIAGKDPHTLPRQLHMVGRKDRLRATGERQAVGRSRAGGVASFDDAEPGVLVDLPHSHRTMVEWLRVTESADVTVLATELKADAWYVSRLMQWTEMQRDVFAAAVRHG